MHLVPFSPEASISHIFFSLSFYLCGCWVKATTVAERPRIAEGGEGQQDLHVGCWAVRSVVTLNHPLACGMEAVSSCMPVVRARPTHPQLFLSSYSLFFFSFSCSLSHSLRVIEYLEMQCKQSGRWQVRRKLSLRVIFTHFHLITLYLKIKHISFSTSPIQLFLFYNSS